MPKNMKFYLYDGPGLKVHAGGYAFKKGRPVLVNEDALTDANREQFTEHKIHAISDKQAARLKGGGVPVEPAGAGGVSDFGAARVTESQGPNPTEPRKPAANDPMKANK